MSQQHYRLNQRPLQQKLFNNYQYQNNYNPNTYNPNQNTYNSPSKITFTHNQNISQPIEQPLPKYNYQHNYTQQIHTTNNKPLKLNQLVNKQINNNQKKFTPITFDKQPVRIQSKLQQQQYAKTTIQTVLIGFFILILVVATFYSIIWLDKNKKATQTIIVPQSIIPNAGTNEINSTGTPVIVSNPPVQVKQQEWTVLPQDQTSPLQAISSFISIGQSKQALINQQPAPSSLSNAYNKKFIHIRRYQV